MNAALSHWGMPALILIIFLTFGTWYSLAVPALVMNGQRPTRGAYRLPRPSYLFLTTG